MTGLIIPTFSSFFFLLVFSNVKTVWVITFLIDEMVSFKLLDFILLFTLYHDNIYMNALYKCFGILKVNNNTKFPEIIGFIW